MYRIKTKIYCISNMADLSPRYHRYWIITSNQSPQVEFKSEKTSSPVVSYLWYNFNPEIHIETWLNYYEEKLGLDKMSGMKLIAKWNKAVNDGLKPIQIDEIIIIDGIRYAFLHEGEGVIVFRYAQHIPPYCTNVISGKGYALTKLKRAVLYGAEITHEMLKHHLGLYCKAHRKMFIKKWNQFILRKKYGKKEEEKDTEAAGL